MTPTLQVTQIHISQTKASQFIQDVSKITGGEVKEDCGLHELEVSSGEFGKIEMAAITFEGGLGFFTCSMELKSPLHLVFAEKVTHPMRFVYCRSGKLEYENGSETVSELQTYQHLIIRKVHDDGYTLKFPAGSKVQVGWVDIMQLDFFSKYECFESRGSRAFDELFAEKEEQKLHIGDYSIHSADLLDKIASIPEKGVLKNLKIEALTLNLLTELVQLFEDDRDDGNKARYFRQSQVDKLQKVKGYMLKNLDSEMTIAHLAESFALSETALKNGFNKVFGTSIRKYLTTERMKAAREMVLFSDVSISDIANSVGYDGHSHFSKTFREYHEMTPTEMRKNMR